MNEDCFAFKDKKCTVLRDLYCKDEKCSFYKTKKQFAEDAKKAKIYNEKHNITYPKKGF